MAAKSQIRKEITKLLVGLSETDKAHQSEQVFNKLINHPKYKQANKVSIYLSTANEVNTEPILRHAIETDKKCCYIPLVLKGSLQVRGEIKSMTRMVFYEIRSMIEYEQLPVNSYGIKEPQQIDDVSGRIANSLDLIVTPGVAFDPTGRRLGHGKGYYDEFFFYWTEQKRANIYTIGLALREQILPEGELPFVEGRDFRLDEVLSG